jgi:hypothetical protein
LTQELPEPAGGRPLSVVCGIESYVILKDICGASDREVESVASSMLEALIEHALRDVKATRPRAGAPAPSRPR